MIQSYNPAAGVASFDTPLSDAPLSDLVDHVIAVHHAALRRHLPTARQLLAEAVADAGEGFEHLHEIGQLFGVFTTAIETHIRREEQVTFPLIRHLDFAVRRGWSYGGGIERGVAELCHEHTTARHTLQVIRDLTSDYGVPLGAPDSVRRLYRGLAELDTSMQQHMDVEEQMLFPRAVTAEAELCGAAGRSGVPAFPPMT